jgi:hypothetical protein
MIDATGTSFHDATIRATLKQMLAMLGSPDDDSNTGEDKVNYEWVGTTSSGDVYTVYDWKEYHQIGLDETVNWHIGAHSKAASNRALAELTGTLAKRKAVQA